MIKNNTILLIVAIFVIGGLLWYGNSTRQDNAVVEDTTQEQEQQVASVAVSHDEENKVSIPEATFTAGATALEVTESVVDVKTSGEGTDAFVTAIDGREASKEDNEFWSFMVNGEAATVGAGSYEVQDRDVISWELETY